MSKIEEVLKKARAQRQGLAVRAGGAPAPVPPGNSGGLAPRLSAREQIARMQEPAVVGDDVLSTHRWVYPDMREERVANAFRNLRTRLLQKLGDDKRIVMVTGVSERAGASFVARNLAAAVTFDEGKTALLIDCHMRLPGPALPGTPVSPGLTDFLESEVMPVEDVIHAIGVPRLRVIPVGARRESGAEYFTSDKMLALLVALKQRYDDRFIFLDAPPVADSADARILSALCDGVVLVVPYGGAFESDIAAAAKAVGDKLLGVVLNDQPRVPHLSLRKHLLDWWLRLRRGRASP